MTTHRCVYSSKNGSAPISALGRFSISPTDSHYASSHKEIWSGEPALEAGNGEGARYRFRPVPDTLAALHVNPETGLTHAEMDNHRAAIRAGAVIGLLRGLLAVGYR